MPKSLEDLPMIFLCGCPHSGTSLLTAMVGAHPAVYSIPVETAVFSKEKPEAEIREVFAKYVPEAKAKGASYICEKTPNHLKRIGAMHEMFPDAPIVVIVRDARDVSASLRERDGDLEYGAKRWISFNRIAQQAQKSGSPPIHVLRYEDLVADPQAELQKMCDYIGIPFDPAMLEYYKDEREWNHAKGRAETDGKWGDNHRNLRNWQVHQPVMDRREKWREKLNAEEVALVEERCGALMDYFGYKRELVAK
jgi:protein O-GlcNAc transferase